MADDLNKPSFYPRVGNIRPKSRSPLDSAVDSLKQVAADGRAMEFPFGQYDLSVPTKANRDLSNRMLEREIDLKRQADEAMSPLEKIAGGMQTARLFGSGLTQAINSIPTRIAYGSEAGDKFIQDRMYRPTQEKAYEYADDVGNFLERLETQYKIPPILPEVASLQNVVGPASKQAARAAKQGAKVGAKAGANLVGNAINDAMVYNTGPLAAITPQPMRMFIGPQAKTFDFTRLRKAEDMLAAGATPDEVYMATGTRFTKDGVPRQEISDKEAIFRRPSELKALAEENKQQIDFLKEKLKPSKQKDLFPKELTAAKRPVRQEIDALKEDVRSMSKNPRTQGVAARWTLEHPELYRAYPDLADINVTQRPTIGAEKGSLTNLGGVIRDLEVKDINDPRSVALHEMQHAIQNIEGMSPGASPEMAFNAPEYKAIFDELKGALPDDMSSSMRRKIERDAAMEWYRRQHGEAEARATQQRQYRTQEERNQRNPMEDFDVEEDQLLYRKGLPFLGIDKSLSVEGASRMPEDLKAAREAMRAKAAEEQALLDAYNRATRGMPLDQRPSMEEFRATNMQPSQADLDQMRLDLDEQRFGIGGEAKSLVKLAKLARAPAKSKAEIEAVAQRIAPQLTGEFVRGSTGTQSVAGKTQKQFAREKELKHDIRPTGAERPLPKEVSIEDLQGKVMMGIAGDPTITGQTVHSVAGQPLRSPSPQHGGPLYGLGHDKEHFWASNLGAARGVQNRAREIGEQYDTDVIGKYIMMGPESINYAQHFADANLYAINPERMTKSQIEGFNRLIRQGSPKSGPRPGFPGIENPEEAYLQFAIDPELRKHFNALMQMPTVTEKFNLPSGIDVRHAITEPDLRNLETGVTGKSVGLMRPDLEDLKLSEHPTYSHDIPGEFMGGLKYPVPYDLAFPDTLKAVRENPKQAGQEFGSLKMVGPRQIIDPQHIDEIKQYEEFIKKYTGKADGGEITVKPKKMATGGEITAEDLEIEERPL